MEEQKLSRINAVVNKADEVDASSKSAEEESHDIGYYFTFRLGREIYGIEILKVKEVVEMLKITRVPQASDFKLGVINLRGSIVPVVDLHKKFQLEEFEETIDSAIIIVETVINDEVVTIGSVVDQIEEVARLKPSRIDAALQIGSQLKRNYISGIGKKDNSFIIILDVDSIFSKSELLGEDR